MNSLVCTIGIALVAVGLASPASAQGPGSAPPIDPKLEEVLAKLPTPGSGEVFVRTIPADVLRGKTRSSPHPSALFGPVCDRPSASRFVLFRENRPQRRLGAVLTGRNGPGHARTVANRAGTALTGAVRTGGKTGARAPASERAIPSKRALYMMAVTCCLHMF